MFRSWEIAPEHRERAHDLEDVEWKYRQKTADRWEDGRGLMSELYSLSPAIISKPPDTTLRRKIHDISSSQSIVKLLPYFTDLLETSPVHPETVAEILRSLTNVVSVSYQRAPVARNIRDLFVEVDKTLSTEEGKRVTTDSFLAFTEALIDDPNQTSIGFINNHVFLTPEQIANIRAAIKAKDTRYVADSMAAFWQNENEFADDKTVNLAYHLWSEIGERRSEDDHFPVPKYFDEVGEAFRAIAQTNNIRLSDRRVIATFYQQAKKIGHLLTPTRKEIVRNNWYTIILGDPQPVLLRQEINNRF